jgi:putative restriction endonuclease
MNSFELKDRINNLSIWKKGDQRAPHKPLLILFALGQLQADKPRFISYEVTREKLTELLREFGPLRKSYHPEEPFVRLRRDGIWLLDRDAQA